MGSSTLRFVGAMEKEGQAVPARDPEDTEVSTKQNAYKFLPESAIAEAPVNCTSDPLALPCVPSRL